MMENKEQSKMVPKRRFKAFENDSGWDRCELGEKAEIIAGGDIDKSKIKGYGRYPVIANALNNAGIVGYYEDSYRVEGPAVTVTGRGDVGYAKARNYNFTPVVRLLSLKSEFDTIFLENSINNHNVFVESTGVPQLTIPQLGKYKILFPKLEEQIRIGEFFQSLNQTITLQQQKLEKLKAMKSAYLSEMFPEEGERKPTRRFPGFTDDWEQCELGEILDFSITTNSLSRNMLNYYGGELRSIHYGDILINYGSILDVKTDVIPFVTGGKVKDFSSQLLKNGDIVFADAAEDETVGKAVEINGLRNADLVAGLHTIVGRPLSKFAERYLGYYINSNSYHRQLIPLMQGTKVSSISKNTLQKTKIIYPNSISEQQDIGEFFTNLDQTITLQQEKLEKLQNIKKAYLNEMFI